MQSVYDIGNEFMANFLDSGKIATGDNLTKTIMEVGTLRRFIPAQTTSNDKIFHAGAELICVYIAKENLVADANSVQIIVLESDDTIASNFTPVSLEQLNFTDQDTHELGQDTYKGNTANPPLTDVRVNIKYNGFKKYVRVNIKGTGAMTGDFGVVIIGTHLENQHAPIQFEPTNP